MKNLVYSQALILELKLKHILPPLVGISSLSGKCKRRVSGGTDKLYLVPSAGCTNI